MNQLSTLAIVTLIFGAIGLTLTVRRQRRRAREALRWLPFDERGSERRLGRYHPRWRSERAQVAVELALFGTMFLLLAVAFLQIGIAYQQKSALDWAARNAAALEAQGQDPTSYVQSAAPSGTTITGASCAGGFGSVALSVDTAKFLPDVPLFPSSLQSTAVATAASGTCI